MITDTKLGCPPSHNYRVCFNFAFNFCLFVVCSFGHLFVSFFVFVWLLVWGVIFLGGLFNCLLACLFVLFYLFACFWYEKKFKQWRPPIKRTINHRTQKAHDIRHWKARSWEERQICVCLRKYTIPLRTGFQRVSHVYRMSLSVHVNDELQQLRINKSVYGWLFVIHIKENFFRPHPLYPYLPEVI